METAAIDVTLTGFFHKNQHCMGIHFANHGSLNGPLRKAGALWSATHKCWWVPLSKAWYEKVVSACGDRVKITRDAMNDYLRKNPPAALPLPAETKRPLTPQEKRIIALATIPREPAKNVNPLNYQAWTQLRNYTIAEGKAVSTIRNYLADFNLYLAYLGNEEAAKAGKEKVIEYLVYCLTEQGISHSTANCRLNAIKKILRRSATAAKNILGYTKSTKENAITQSA